MYKQKALGLSLTVLIFSTILKCSSSRWNKSYDDHPCVNDHCTSLYRNIYIQHISVIVLMAGKVKTMIKEKLTSESF